MLSSRSPARPALRLLHFADTHLGVENYGRVDPATGLHTRLTDFARCLERLVDLALEHEVDAALFAGDAYRSATPTPTHQRLFTSAIKRLVDAGVPLVMVAGNHDLPLTFGHATALDVFTTFAADRVRVVRRPELVVLPTRAGALQVACLPWPTRGLLVADEALAAEGEEALRLRLEGRCREAIAQLAAQLDPALPAVLLAHVMAQDAVYTGSEKALLGAADPMLSRGMLADPRFDYVALGHVHRFQDLNPGARPPVVYCGSTERLDFGEHGDTKGGCLVTIDKASGEVGYEQLPLPARPFVALSYPIPAGADPTEWLVERLRGLDVAEAVVRLSYRCDDAQYQALDLRAVRAALAEAHVVAGMIRERPPEEHRPRVEITEHLGVLDALGRYLDTRPELADRRAALLAAGRELEEELRRSETAGD